MARRRLAGVIGAIVLAVVAAVGSWRIYRVRTPAYAIEQAIEAIRTREPVGFATYIDVDRVAAHLADEIVEKGLEDAASSSDDMLFVGFASVMLDGLKSSFRHEIVTSVENWLRTGDLGELEEDSPAAILSDLWWMLPLDGYQGLSGKRDVAGGVLVGMEFRYADLDTTLVLDLRLEKAGKTWRVVALENFIDYALGLEAVQDLRLADVNRPTIERLSKEIAIGDLQRRSSGDLWSMSEIVELGLPVTNRSSRPMSAVALKATYTVGGEEKTIVFATNPATVIGPGETALAVYRHAYRMMFASPEDRALAHADAASLRLEVIPVHAVFRDGEKADTIRVYGSWNAYRARSNG